MSMHTPGEPGDLPRPEVMWGRWGLAAVLTADGKDEGVPFRTGWWFEGPDTLRRDDCGTTEWTFRRLGEGRYVLHGLDDCGEFHVLEKSYDLLAGAPGWLPVDALRALVEDDLVGCVYWYGDGAWGRAPYPPELRDDGLDIGMDGTLDPERALTGLGLSACELGPMTDTLTAAADSRTLSVAHLDALGALAASVAGVRPPDLPAMRRALEVSGLGGSPA